MRLRVALLALATMLVGCGAPPTPIESRFEAPMGALFEYKQSSGNRVRLLVDRDQVFSEVLEVIANARHTLQVEVFLLGGTVGKQIADRLIERHNAGVSVQLLVDPRLGVFGKQKEEMEATVKRLKAAGIPVLTFASEKLPKGPRFLSRIKPIAHAKLVIADGVAAIAGGVNFSDEGADAHDFMARIDGPAAAHLSSLHTDDWTAAGGQPIRLPRTRVRGGKASISISETGFTRQNVLPLVRGAFAKARRSIAVEALLLDRQEYLDELIAAHQRGVQVRVLLDATAVQKFAPKLPLINKLPLDALGNLTAIATLHKAGVPVKLYQPTDRLHYLHSKLAVVDSELTLMGSANFTYQATMRNREVMMAIADQGLASQVMRVFEDDWANHGKPAEDLSRWQRILAEVMERLRDGLYDPPEADAADAA